MANILIVDDEVDSCHFIQKGLKREGFNVDVALDGKEALNKIEKDEYDFIFLDFYMPGLNGIEVAKIIKEKSRKSIVTMISGCSVDGHFSEEIGVSEFLEKPFSFQDIKAIIYKYTGEKPRRCKIRKGLNRSKAGNQTAKKR